MEKSIACLGAGVMGSAMAERLLSQGYAVTVSNRTAGKARVTSGDRSATVAPTPAAAVADHRTVLLALSDDEAEESVLFGPGGAAEAMKPGTYVIDTSTVSPPYARSSGRRLRERGVHRVEACLIGNAEHARTGQLRILAAGEPEDVQRAQEVLGLLSKSLLRLGGTGEAAAVKLAFNSLLGAQLVAVAEAVHYAERVGVDPATMLTAIAESGYSSPALSFRCRLMRDGAYDPPAFRTALMAKDLRMMAEETRDAGVRAPLLDVAASRFADMGRDGRGELDAAAVLEQQRGDGTLVPYVPREPS
ncbi:NAD(P)-dependent oxidoreductase [Streptomyces sp. SCA3-4]|uniref:NAD(P)-dependent oxidoreductase n=1 Tax=Streptomyces sichuanensis TaxID=2871810 RepID=UPI001CE39735|nr:NAD(P)-dependent oxidoreductase [Streptomyces sichuanensis]MCA6091934.1 NAD(P)-dependent oxidoreductase [Streptomyces sichuanensis]